MTPDIRVRFDSGAQTVTVADNGIGMSREVVEALFTTIGTSASQLGDNDFQVVGEFGVGVISYFLVADPFELHTYEIGGEPIGLRFPAAMLDGATPAEEISPARSDPGTTVVFRLRDEDRFALLIERFGYWFRGVQGLVADRDGVSIPQGDSAVSALRTELPDVPTEVDPV